MFLIAFGAYLITTCFFDVYNMAVDTLFLCFLEDCERHDGSREKPYFMSKKLMLILKKKNNGTLVDSSSQAKGKSSKTNNWTREDRTGDLNKHGGRRMDALYRL